MAPPSISANDVEMETATAEPSKMRENAASINRGGF